MKRVAIFGSLLISLVLAGPCRGAAPLHTCIFDDNFRSLKVIKEDDFFALPVIRLGSDDVITFSFDEMGDDYSLLEYRLLHCNADWTQSRLLESEYLPRFNTAKVDDYAFSSNTYRHFINYRITIPNEEIAPLVSGNYILQVVPESQPDSIILQARFSVVEELGQIDGKASSKTDRGADSNFQQLSFSLRAPRLSVSDPFTELIAVVEQNNDPSSVRFITTPLRVSNSEIVYEHIPALLFPAGNEFRRFETVRADYPGLRIDSVGFIDPAYQAWVSTDYPRRDSQYFYDSTQNGRFLIREYNATDSDLGADYVVTHFRLKAPRFINGDVYVEGEFSGWNHDRKHRMYYDYEAGEYCLALPLKQGSYNYRYSLDDDPAPIEGDKPETSNEYSVKIYYRTPGSRADRLIAVGQFFTTP